MTKRERFEDRQDAGRQLVAHLRQYSNRDDVVVLGLARGGIPVAYEIATALNVPLDVFVVRKLGVPSHEELAIGAIASGDVRVLNQQLIDYLGISASAIDAVEESERRELQRRETLYRKDRPMPRLRGKVVILVDDGLATGATMKAALLALREHQPAQVVVAVPTAARETCADIRQMNVVDDIVCLITPERFQAVGMWYDVFEQTDDATVQALLEKAYQQLEQLLP